MTRRYRVRYFDIAGNQGCIELWAPDVLVALARALDGLYPREIRSTKVELAL